MIMWKNRWYPSKTREKRLIMKCTLFRERIISRHFGGDFQPCLLLLKKKGKRWQDDWSNIMKRFFKNQTTKCWPLAALLNLSCLFVQFVANNLLVIGGAGYIGSHVVLELIDHGYHVTVFDNLSTGTKKNLHDVSFNKGDILDENSWSKAFGSGGLV